MGFYDWLDFGVDGGVADVAEKFAGGPFGGTVLIFGVPFAEVFLVIRVEPGPTLGLADESAAPGFGGEARAKTFL